MPGGSEAPRHLARAARGDAPAPRRAAAKPTQAGGRRGPERGSSPSRPGVPKSLHLLAATSRSAGAGDAGCAGGPLPRPASPGRLRAAPPAAGGLPSPALTAAAATAAAGAARGRSTGLQPSGPRPHPAPAGGGEAERQRVAVLGLPGPRSGKLLRAGVRRAGRAREASAGGCGGGRDAAASPGWFHF